MAQNIRLLRAPTLLETMAKLYDVETTSSYDLVPTSLLQATVGPADTPSTIPSKDTTSPDTRTWAFE